MWYKNYENRKSAVKLRENTINKRIFGTNKKYRQNHAEQVSVNLSLTLKKNKRHTAPKKTKTKPTRYFRIHRFKPFFTLIACSSNLFASSLSSSISCHDSCIKVFNPNSLSGLFAVSSEVALLAADLKISRRHQRFQHKYVPWALRRFLLRV